MIALDAERRVALMERVFVVETGCWPWGGVVGPYGYGRFHLRDGRTVAAHRAVYEALVGEIPDGLVIDHLCRNRACVNPAHMDPVTNAENIRRGMAPTIVASRQNRCMNGHPLVEGNIRWNSGNRQCRICRNASRMAANRARGVQPEKPAAHGGQRAYKAGCRCPVCMDAMRERGRHRRQQLRERSLLDTPPSGGGGA